MSDTEHAQMFTRTSEKTPPYLAYAATVAVPFSAHPWGHRKITPLPRKISPAGGELHLDTRNHAATLRVMRVLIRCTACLVGTVERLQLEGERAAS